ncbi:MAG: tRNA pseudouridine(38-40) synthase TruA [Lachnospiraceae bacterium]|nr:tRNA pseudouridine(38-40) synthase TruA [Lachnospiraceae bacterium]
MKRVLLKVAYDGSAYHGWAEQDNAVSVCGSVRDAILSLTGERPELIGASRTDAGVHALCNLAVFDTASRIPAEKFSGALNIRLPEDIVIRESSEAAPDFSPRTARTIKTYRYRILRDRYNNPLERLYSWRAGYELNVERMREAAGLLTGENDFRSFASSHAQVLSTVREITAVSVEENGSYIDITVRGYGFLYNMVRIITGTLVEAGRGRLEPEEISEILAARDRRRAGPTAPPQGLTLMDIEILPGDPGITG